jgi:ATP-dependent RNA helicase DeaD
VSRKDIDTELLKERLGEILQEIHDSEDPEELNLYRSIFKKHVSMFRRSYVTAYLMKYYLAGAPKSSPKKSSRTDLVSLFVGIGKSRRVYPKDLVGLILDTTPAKKDDIGVIKILDNYSFVEIAPEKADAIIQNLNGMTYRGRTLNVNYAKKKD